MRILHFADLHIGVENHGRIDPNTGLSSRLGDFLRTYDELVDYAIDTSIDLVLFCGDAYKSRDPSQTHQREFAKRIARLSGAGIPTFLLVGNHDTPQVIAQATALEIFPTLNVANVHIGDRLQTYLVETRDGPLQVVALPWIKRSDFLASDAARGMTHQQINDAIQRMIDDAVRFQAEQLDASVPAVFAGHVTIGQSTLASEQSMMLGHDHVLMNSSVALPQFEYVALGHVHRHQVLSRNPYVVYSGSPQRVDFGEEKDDKGFCVIELDPDKPQGSRLTSFEFVKNDARPFLTIDVKLNSGDDDPTATVIKVIESADLAGAIVRLRITLPAELEPLLVESSIRNALRPAHHIASIAKDVADRARTRLGDENTRGLMPKDALRLYFDTRDVPNDRAETLMRYAEELIAERE
ncbi:MAG: exonuclease SbcCD subunit D [Chloroflexota bacterium]|nr:exonuclease SbcCD subunit D [Chloroflexota bacterium]